MHSIIKNIDKSQDISPELISKYEELEIEIKHVSAMYAKNRNLLNPITLNHYKETKKFEQVDQLQKNKPEEN